MANACSCNYGLGNSKVPGCEPIAAVAHGLIFVPYFDSTGAVNSIDLSETLDSTFFAGLVANTKARDKRWRPFVRKKIESVNINRAESVFDTFDSGNKYFVQSGDKSFAGEIPHVGAGVIKFFDSARCEQMGVYVVDVNGNLVGNGSVAGELRPFRIQDQTLDARDIPAKDKNVQRVMLVFNFDKTEEDGDIAMVENTEMTYDLKNLDGLYDAFGVFSSISTGGFTLDLRTHFGSAKNPIRVTGLVKADFTLTKVSDGSTVSITTTTESTTVPGTYAFVATLTSAATYRLTFLKTGYDPNELSKQDIVIP